MSQYILPAAFQVAGVHCGIKRNPNKEDLTLLVAERPVVAAGVYTQNRVFAAPVALDRERTPSDNICGVVVNSGNANACTGPRGMDDARRMAELTAQAVGASAEQILVLSTGIIGEFLPMEKIAVGINNAAGKLAADETAMTAAARGMMTTDSVHKLAAGELTAAGQTAHILGFCKGAAMIGPNMATMLAVLLTDAAITPADAQRVLAESVEASFNCLSVEGHMSTNDTVLLLASGTGEPLAGETLSEFESQVKTVCTDLARAIADDGEGTTHLVTIEVCGCASVADARQIARTVANSALVKTAIAGADPNWGRIVSAAGYSGIAFDPQGVRLTVQGTLLYEQGVPVPFDAAKVSAAIRDNRETYILLEFAEGAAAAEFYTTDLTTEYVRLNADYHT